jgi:hypothetical protein
MNLVRVLQERNDFFFFVFGQCRGGVRGVMERRKMFWKWQDMMNIMMNIMRIMSMNMPDLIYDLTYHISDIIKSDISAIFRLDDASISLESLDLRAKNKSEENFPPLSSDDQRPSAFCAAATPLQNKEDEGDDGDGQHHQQGRIEEGREREGEKTKDIFKKSLYY